MAITFDGYSEITGEEMDKALEFCNQQIIRNLPRFTDQFQKAYSENGLYQPIPNNYWTCGFWTGEIWLAYEFSGDEGLKAAGEKQTVWQAINLPEIRKDGKLLLRQQTSLSPAIIR